MRGGGGGGGGGRRVTTGWPATRLAVRSARSLRRPTHQFGAACAAAALLFPYHHLRLPPPRLAAVGQRAGVGGQERGWRPPRAGGNVWGMRHESASVLAGWTMLVEPGWGGGGGKPCYTELNVIQSANETARASAAGKAQTLLSPRRNKTKNARMRPPLTRAAAGPPSSSGGRVQVCVCVLVCVRVCVPTCAETGRGE